MIEKNNNNTLALECCEPFQTVDYELSNPSSFDAS